MTERKSALIISSFWATVLGGLISSAILGGVTYAWAQNNATVTLQTQVAALQQAALPSRMDKLESKVDYANENISEIKNVQRTQADQQSDINRKLDILVRSDRRER